MIESPDQTDVFGGKESWIYRLRVTRSTEYFIVHVSGLTAGTKEVKKRRKKSATHGREKLEPH